MPAKPDLRTEAGYLLPSISDLRRFAHSLSLEERRDRYPNLAGFAREICLPQDTLIASFEIEDMYHDLVMKEPSAEIRRRLNDEVYKKVFHLYGAVFRVDLESSESSKDLTVKLLRSLLQGRSILDIGCGSGDFLLSCARQLDHGHLLGLDVFVETMNVPDRNLSFRRSDVVQFEVEYPFDVAITDNVYEHLAPADVDDHLRSVRRALKSGGVHIVLTPHAAFGPWDVTRIIDNSYTGWTLPRGTHLNETTYSGLRDRLEGAGFVDLRVVPPRVRLGDRAGPLRRPVDRYCRAERKPALMRWLQALDKRSRFSAFEICMVAVNP